MSRTVASIVALAWLAVPLVAQDKPDFSKVPGVVIDHTPAASGIFVGSPSIAMLASGELVASHDEFGPKSTENKSAITRIFTSADKGRTWKPLATIDGAFWSSLFVHNGALYLIGPCKGYGDLVIRRSDDGGKMWTSPRDEKSGLIARGNYHCAPVPVVVHNGRIWRAMEDGEAPGGWGKHFRSMMISAPADADLLDAASWTISNRLARDAAWLEGTFNGWLEGNAVVTPDGKMVNILRVDTPQTEYAAIVRISGDGKTASFDPAKDFVKFPGGAKKFTIRFDPRSRLYWTLVNYIPPRHLGPKPGGTRNTLALMSSADLRQWEVKCIVLYHPDREKHGFQYVDWLFDGADIIAACRTAYDDGLGGARNMHDANFLTFHRIANFRELTMKDSVPMPEMAEVRHDLGGLTVAGYGFELAKLETRARAFSNRDYVWEAVPPRFEGWTITRTAGGVHGQIRAKAAYETTLHAVGSLARKGDDLAGWTPVEGTVFSYSDKGHTKMAVLERKLSAGEEIILPQTDWTGMLLLAKP